LIASGLGWCNEQCRVFIALCEVMEIPARLCFLFHANGRTGHTATEVLDRDHWRVCDVTFGLLFGQPARECSSWRRPLDAFYAGPLRDYYSSQTTKPFDIERGGDLFAAVGICNYLIEGVEALA
jgi:transglutaminase-like putative cysteine protease